MKTRKRKLDPPRVLVIGFTLIIAIGTLLLTLPIATVDGNGLSFLNALFTSTSATCVTGLVVVDTGSTFTVFGELVILSMIQIGGLGFMTFATAFFILLGKKISFRDRITLQESLNQLSVEGIVKLVKRILVFTLLIELIGGFILAYRFTFDMSVGKAYYYGFFHSISNFNNAGFDLMGHFQSLTLYVNDPTITLTVSTLITLGGIGFIVWNDLLDYRKTRRLSEHTKVVLVTNLVLTLGGALLIFLLEYSNAKTAQTLPIGGKVWSALFQSVTARTAGSNTLNIPDLAQPTLFFMIFLMFIGASPGSTGGGIKTTTFATLLGAVWSQIKGKDEVVLFRRSFTDETIFKALTVTILSLFFVLSVTMLLTITESGQDFLVVLFEATSAFATVGLSMGLTPELSPIGRTVIILTMFAGRVGPLTIAYALTKRRNPDPFRYPKGKMMIG
jgi:trk system potassium uptake protein